MKSIRNITPRRVFTPFNGRGFSLLEIMIALTLGLLLSVGIMTLFGGTSRTNKLQDGLAQLQENGRFALTRMSRDLRMAGAQYCSSSIGASAPGTVVPVLPRRAPMVYAPDIALPDSNIRSIDASGFPSASATTVAYALSPRWFVQGYSCTAASCTPAVPTGAGLIPDMGLADGKRVPASDVLTVRYQRGSGWPLATGTGACSVAMSASLGIGATMTLNPQQAGDDDITTGMTPGLALVSDCVNPVVIPISAVSGNVLTVGNILGGATGAVCAGGRGRDARVFNFTTDFVTVSYYLAFRSDENPDARPNSAAAQRLIPVLIKSENGLEQELVRGVDQLVFRYAVQDATGSTRIMSAAEVEGASSFLCTQPPAGLDMEPGCMWRMVRTIEPHLLVNTVDEVHGLDAASRTFRFDGVEYTKAETDTLPSGIMAGSQLRREFIAYISNRNVNL